MMIILKILSAIFGISATVALILCSIAPFILHNECEVCGRVYRSLHHGMCNECRRKV